MAATPLLRSPQVLDRYVILEEIASGGMATVHLGRLLGAAGFARPVAIKRLHAQYARDPEFVSMLIDEARVAARVLHPNVVATLDVVSEGPELFLVMEYVAGASLSTLLDAVRAQGGRIPPAIAISIMTGVLFGLHAAHEATTERGEPLGIVHRDVSPQNVLLGFDGVARVHDFGIAKAVGRVQTTREGQLKGKLRYMAPEQLRGEDVTRQTDIYAAAVVLWEALTCERLFTAENDAALFGKVLEGVVPPPSRHVPELSTEIDLILLRALDRAPARRFATARDMALALQESGRPASATEVGEYAERVLGPEVVARARRAADPSDPLVGDEAPTLPLAPDHKPLLHVVRTETAPRALPAGLLARGDEAPGSARPKSLPAPPGTPDKTRTETVQRALPFALPDDGSGSTRALSASVPPPKKSIGTIAILAAVAFVGGTAIAALVGYNGASSQAPAPLETGAGKVRDRVAELPRGVPQAPSETKIQLDDVPVQAEVKPPADPPKPKVTRSRPRAKSPKKQDCKQLVYTDSTGIRRVKVNCL